MIGRRLLLAGMAALPASGALAALPFPPARRLGFRVVRNGSGIGQHVLTFEPDGSRLTVRISVDLAVGFGPITLYRYRHRAVERWDDGSVVSFEAETNDDGSRSTITMRRQGDALAVDSSRAGRYVAPPGALPATHWNRQMLDGPFINTQTGEVLRPAVRREGPEPLPWAPQRLGDRFVLSGAVDLETWYDASRAWLGLRFRGSDGSAIHYEVA
ncbi:DUF6134 family protein [Neoroseomonas soli]|uniref:DUF3108 domain-containing protein n=1 Tax=Neoroseomonas soli TaxID=1081025 RepID=A0A9X9WZ63_9PROT|nr:DUF6134 family protein [Neoroseomonas soli]MBR0672442.1 hypothetical protein [Neoroseomonas soli]